MMFFLLSVIGIVLVLTIIGGILSGPNIPEFLMLCMFVIIEVVIFHILFLGGYTL